MHRSLLTIIALIAFLVGIAAGTYFDLPYASATDWHAGKQLLVLATAGIATLIGVCLAYFGRRWPIVILISVITIGGSLGFARYEYSQPKVNAGTLAQYNDNPEKVTITGIVSEPPDTRIDHTKLTVRVMQWENALVKRTITDGSVLVKLPRVPAYAYGDELKMVGILQTPFETNEFSYKNYLARYGIDSVMYRPHVERISIGNGNLLFAALVRLRDSFEGAINRTFPEPDASFLAGLTTGSRKGIPERVTDDFNTTGLTHIVAISGYNIAMMIALAVAIVGKFVRRQWQFPFVALFVIAFTIFVGAGASVVRAAIMGLLAFFAVTIGRQYNAALAITLTAVAMVAWEPRTLLSDVSFQLSFAAVLGLMFVAPVFERWLARVPSTLAIRESLVMTLSAQVTAAPLIVFYFDRLSLIAPLANLFVAPAIPLAMALGFVATLVGWMWVPAGIGFGYFAHLILAYILWIAHSLATLPLASVDVTWFGKAAVGVYYVGLVGWLGWWHQHNNLTKN